MAQVTQGLAATIREERGADAEQVNWVAASAVRSVDRVALRAMRLLVRRELASCGGTNRACSAGAGQRSDMVRPLPGKEHILNQVVAGLVRGREAAPRWSRTVRDLPLSHLAGGEYTREGYVVRLRSTSQEL